MNTLTATELKRLGIAAIEKGFGRGNQLHLIKRNHSNAVVLA